MTQALDRLMAATAPITNSDDLWDEALQGARRSSRVRRAGGESSEQRMQRLRGLLQTELVAFHDRLIVTPHAGEQQPTMSDSRLWDVGIPLTLFPQRDQGFSRLECVVEFNAPGADDFRVLGGYPEQRAEIMARASIEGKLDFDASAKMGLALPQLQDSAAAEVAGELLAGIEITRRVYEARRQCVEAENIGGRGFRWRLDDLQHPERVGAESHQLQVVLEVAETAGPIDGAGYLNAYSDTRWLTATIGSVWRDFRGALGNFFKRGLPTEAYAEWESIIAGNP